MITFDKEKHEYKNDKGEIIPNVTRIIQEAGLTPYEYANRQILEDSAYFGNAVHLACELFDKNDLEENSIDPMIKPYLDAWVKFKKDVLKDLWKDLWHVEKIVYSEKLRYAGTLDRTAIIKGKYAVVDIKSSKTIYPFVEIQTSAYMFAINEMLEISGKNMPYNKIETRYCVQLLGDGSYKLTEHKDHIRDLNVFISALNIYNWKNGKGIKSNEK